MGIPITDPYIAPATKAAPTPLIILKLPGDGGLTFEAIYNATKVKTMLVNTVIKNTNEIALTRFILEPTFD